MKMILSLVFLVSQYTFAMGPCHEDMQKFCAGVEKGEGRIMKCMKEKEAELSQACKDHRAKMKEHMSAMKESCHDDMMEHCGDVEKGKGKMMKCMKENKDKLSDSCKESMGHMKGHMKHMKNKKGE